VSDVPDPVILAEALDLLADIVRKAKPRGDQDDGFVAYYWIPTGPIHSSGCRQAASASAPDAPSVPACGHKTIFTVPRIVH
jgi:hypothetical protein